MIVMRTLYSCVRLSKCCRSLTAVLSRARRYFICLKSYGNVDESPCNKDGDNLMQCIQYPTTCFPLLIVVVLPGHVLVDLALALFCWTVVDNATASGTVACNSGLALLATVALGHFVRVSVNLGPCKALIVCGTKTSCLELASLWSWTVLSTALVVYKTPGLSDLGSQ